MIARAPGSLTTTDARGPDDIDRTRPPRTPAELHAWLRTHADINVATVPMLPGSTAPFDYLVHTFFEGAMGSRDRGTMGSRKNAASLPTPYPSGLDPTIPRSLDPFPPDCVLWANRGGGKTFLGAVATMLDLVFKPGIQVRILGGSLEQSRRMHEHLRRLFERPTLAPLLDGRITDKRLRLLGGSAVEVLAQSETAVRGTRVQKLRCDEVELFDRDVWNAAQLTTRSMRLKGPWGAWVRGSVEALSTMHHPYGLMWEIVGEAGGMGSRDLGIKGSSQSDNASPSGVDPTVPRSLDPTSTPPPPRRRLFRWGVLDVLAPCGPEHRCDGCSLWDECRGRAKGGRKTGIEGPWDRGIKEEEGRATPRANPRHRPLRTRSHDPKIPRSHFPRPGHIAVADAITMKSRVDLETWNSEMLCLRPRRSHAVFPEFDPALHLIDGPLDPPTAAYRPPGTLVCGMDFGFRAPTVILWALSSPDGTLRIIDERVVSQSLLAEHIRAITLGEGAPGSQGWPAPAWVGVDPAGRARHEQTGLSNADQLRRAGLTVHARPLSLHEGLNLVRARLAPADASAPRLFIHRRCVKLIESLQRYHYPEDQPESIHPCKDGHDHAADALRYLLVALDRPYTTRSACHL